jgi:hypothetical protein
MSAADVRRMEAIVARMKRFDVRIRYIDGWRDRGRPYTFTPRGILDHHDASSTNSGTWGALGIIVAGRTGIPGPLSQFQIARGDEPQVAIVAAGRANHAGTGGGPGRLPAGIPKDSGNAYLFGAEKANNGVGEPYSAATLYAAKSLFVAVLEVVT